MTSLPAMTFVDSGNCILDGLLGACSNNASQHVKVSIVDGVPASETMPLAWTVHGTNQPAGHNLPSTGGHFRFPRFPNGTGITVSDSSNLNAGSQPLNMPTPTVGTAASASSSAAGLLASPLDLKLLIQATVGFGERFGRLAGEAGFDNLGTCTDGAQDHTASGCRYPAARFIDGTYTDNNALAILVGHLQQKHPGKRLRIAVHVSTECSASADPTVTLPVACTAAATQAAADYFDTSDGASNWCPDCIGAGPLPAPPRQIFEGAPPAVHADPLTAESNDDHYFSYVVGQNLTTVGNAMYGVIPGTKVDLLFLMANTGGEGGNIFSTAATTSSAYGALADAAHTSINLVIRGFYERGVVEYRDPFTGVFTVL